MVYGCDQCNKALPPAATVCPSCGEIFEEAVPADAEARELEFTTYGKKTE